MIIRDLIMTEDRSYLYEGLNESDTQLIKLWENAGNVLKEYAMTADQIGQLFQTVEKDAGAAGGNRTMIGRGKDAASAVGQAWETLKGKVANSGPIKGVDRLYDQAAEKLKQATGGDQGVMQYVQKYRDFAKAHPIAQSLIYSALIAAAGISGAGVGGAAALGLFKMVDKLLQGEKFSSAAYSGAKTGAMAYGASKVGDMFKGNPVDDRMAQGLPNKIPSEKLELGMTRPDGATLQHIGGADGMPNVWSNATGVAGGARQAAGQQAYDAIQSAINNGSVDPKNVFALEQIGQAAIEKLGTNLGGTLSLQSLEAIAAKAATMAAKQAGGLQESYVGTVQLTEAGVLHAFQLAEGPMDWIKQKAGQAAGAVTNKLATIGSNLTNKVTADKLMSAWKKAGSPTDSDQVLKIMTSAGVTPDLASKAIAGAAPLGGNVIKGPAATTTTAPAPATAPAATTTPTTAPPTEPAPAATPTAASPAPADDPIGWDDPKSSNYVGRREVARRQSAPAAAPAATTPNFGLRSTGYASVNQPANVSSTIPATTPTAAPNPFGQMTKTLGAYAPPTTSSTGGTVTQTPTGQVHQAKTNNPNAAVATPAPVKTHTGGKVAGQLSQTPNAVRKRNARSAAADNVKIGNTAPVPKQNWTGRKPTGAQAAEYQRQIHNVAESLSWSRNFNPGMTLFRQMKREQ